MSMLESMASLKDYDPKKEYVVAKHSDSVIQLVKGRKLIGEVPDAVGNGGTMQVWELPVEVAPPQLVIEPEVHTPEPEVHAPPPQQVGKVESEPISPDVVAEKVVEAVVPTPEPKATPAKPKPKPSLASRLSSRKSKGKK